MSEYRGGILEGLTDIFCKALKLDSSSNLYNIDKMNLIKEWNDEIKQLNHILTVGR